MSDIASSPPGSAPPAPRRPRPVVRRVLAVAGVFLCVVLVIAAMAWLNRRAVTRQVLVGWLERQGVPADVDIQRVELDGVVARVRIGDPRNPDVTVERVEVDYVVGAPWSRGGLGVAPSRIRLVRPVARVSLANGKVSFGSLDPLIEQFTGRPPGPDSRAPLVLVEDARVRLLTDYGPADILGDARVEDGKLIRLVARMPQTALRSGDRIDARGLAAAVDLTTTGDRVALRLTASAGAVRLPGVGGEGARLVLTGDLPYPDLKTRRGDGQARLDARLTADRLTTGEQQAAGVEAALAFAGATTGWIETFRIDGRATTDIRASTLSGAVAGRAVRLGLQDASAVLDRTADGLGWRLTGPARVTADRIRGAGLEGAGVRLDAARLVAGGRGAALEAQGPVSVAADRFAAGDLSLGGLRGAVRLDLVADGAVRVDVQGGLRAARGAWPLFGAPARDDIVELGRMKQALSAFAVDVPAFTLSTGDTGARFVLDRPATVTPVNGGVLTIRPGAGPVFSAARGERGGGSLSLTATRGQGLPEAAFGIPRWSLIDGGFTATLDGRAALDFDLARGITLQTRGELTSSGGRLTYTAAGCAPVSVERLELGDNDVTDISGGFCPSGRPMVEVRNGAWRADGRLSGLNASAPFLALHFRDAEGALTADGGPRGVGLQARIASATVVDATDPARFNPLTAAGAARLADQNWTGAFDLSRGGTGLGRLDLAHDGRSGVGGLTIDAPGIVFSEGGLQPADLSPLAGEIVGSPATGSVRFNGRIDWRADGEGASSGRLTIPGLDFTSPAGEVKGLRGVVDFVNLAPLAAAPGQTLHADSVASVAPLTDVNLVFGLDKAALTVEGADLDLAGGSVRIEPLTVPLDIQQGFTGVIVVESVQLDQIVTAAGFGDKVSLDAVVSGRLPFSWNPTDGVRIVGGRLEAIEPGRLSIPRTALSGLEAEGGGEALPPNTVQDLAYQAMENLAFDILSAQVDSEDQGRLGVVFRVRGRHDPPQRQELRIPLAEFISRQFLNRELPLPSGTQIDLTLDTSVNLNELVSDLMALDRARNGRPDVTPADEASP
ncbi:intermembrane phospholipid transport protein YdbH family protein [Brevundimonas sp. FT23028]|uniref:intermembrane phospholipid transport protein YdbH family protein n=1 Tax=Brevundimonas sp. FT23028 TaxID=3393748 RepID=UPI003B586B0A